MSERLIKMVNEALVKRGMKALRVSGLSDATIRNIGEGETVPRKNSAYRLALACGAGEELALELALECVPDEAKETA